MRSKIKDQQKKRNQPVVIRSCLKKRNVSLIKNKIKIMSFHFLCFLFLFNPTFDTSTRVPSPTTRPVSSGRDTRGPRRHGYPCRGKGESSSSSKGTGESPSSPKGAGESQVPREHCKSESRQVPREHCNVIERSLDCLIHKDQNVRLHNYYSLSSKSLSFKLILYHLIFK